MRLTDCLDGLGSSVAYFPKLVKLVGGVQPTLFLCQMYYWQGKQRNEEGWIHKTVEQMKEETGLTRSQQETARKKLKALGLIQERKRGLPRRLEFWLDVDRLKELWEAFVLGIKGAIAEVAAMWDGGEEECEQPSDKCAENHPISAPDTSAQSISTDTPPEITPVESVEEVPNQGEETTEQQFSPSLITETTTPQTSQPNHEDKPSVASFEKAEQTKKPAAKTDRFFGRSKYDIWAERQHPALVYAGEETPWLQEPGKVQYLRFVQDFLVWGGKEFSQIRGFDSADKDKAIAVFQSAMMNNPEKILPRWEQYQSSIKKQVESSERPHYEGYESKPVLVKNKRFAQVTA